MVVKSLNQESLAEVCAHRTFRFANRASTWSRRSLDAIRQRYTALSLAADVQPFFRDMAEQYRRATCVVSRAGATTLAELACAGLPALLVPLPTSAHDHQRLNARLFADHSAALVAEPSSPAADSLRASLVRLLSDTSLRDRLGQNLRSLAQPQAAGAVVNLIERGGTP